MWNRWESPLPSEVLRNVRKTAIGLVGSLLLLVAVGGRAQPPEPLASGARSPGLRVRSGELPRETLLWTQRSEMRRRVLPALVDQPSRQRLLAYGGFTTDGVLADTWEWDGLGWIRRVSSTNPGPRSAVATAFDTLRQRVLLFGGIVALAPSYAPAAPELWQWNGNDWSTVSTQHSPPPVVAPVFTWDTVRNRGMLFGGGRPEPSADGNATMAGLDSLWAFDGRDWSEVTVDGPRPEPRAFASSTWDAAGQRMIVHGGYRTIRFANGQVVGQPEDVCNDTWSWDGERWVQFAQGSVPGEYGFTSMGFDPSLQKVVMIVERPGSPRTEGGGVGETALYVLENEQWQWQSARPNAPTPEAEVSVSGSTVFSMARWSSADRAMLSWGGLGLVSGVPGSVASQAITGVWLASPARGWAYRSPSANLDPLLEAAAAVVGDQAVLFGGYTGEAERRDQTYTWDGGRWTMMSPAAGRPSARRSHAMATLGEARALLFGGYADSLLGDTWVWDQAARRWTRLDFDATSAPPPREQAVMAKLGEHEVLLFGGRAGNTTLDDTWIFSETSGEWRQVQDALNPPARHSATMAQLADGSLVLFAGLNGSTPLEDRWHFDGQRWRLSEPDSATRRYRAQMGYEAHSGRTLLIGGTGDPLRPDVWDFSAEPATPLAPVVRENNELPPRRRQWYTLLPSPRSGSLVVFGGKSDDGDEERLSDTWQLRSYGSACSDSAECGPGRFCTDGVCCEATSCGPCRSCAGHDAPGFCAPRGSYGPEPACALEEGLSCAEDGSCRVANEQSCTANAQCASGTCVGLQTGQGTCCALEGCAVRCEGNELRNPDGSKSSCGAFGCEGQSCKTSCASVRDCAVGAVCAEGVCLLDEAASGEELGCSCRVPAGSSRRSTPALLAAMAVWGLSVWRRRQGAR